MSVVFPGYMRLVFCINTIQEMSSGILYCYVYILLLFNPSHLRVFFVKWKLWVPNTWLDVDNGDEQAWKTRFEWSPVKKNDFSTGGSQIDFAAVSYSLPVEKMEVVQDAAFNTDHCPIAVRLKVKKENHRRRSMPSKEETEKQQQQQAFRNSEPTDSWPAAISKENIDWSS